MNNINYSPVEGRPGENFGNSCRQHDGALDARREGIPWRKTRRRIRSGPVYRWRYSGTPERVLIAFAVPQAGGPADRAGNLLWPLPAFRPSRRDRGPIALLVEVPNFRGWLKSLHGFHWLRHMRASGTELAAANARAWCRTGSPCMAVMNFRRRLGPGTAKRIIAWLRHSSVVLQGAEFPFYRSFLKSLAVQIRYLRSVAREMPKTARTGCAPASPLAFAALSLRRPFPGAAQCHSQPRRGPGSPDPAGRRPRLARNPMAVLGYWPTCCRCARPRQPGRGPARSLMGAIDRMLPALRFFHHQDGSLARFNGMGATIQDRIAAVLPRRHHRPAAAACAAFGYERLSVDGVTVIADTNPARCPTCRASPAASFELSSGRQHYIVNAGTDLPMAAEVPAAGAAPARRIPRRRSATPRRRDSAIPRASAICSARAADRRPNRCVPAHGLEPTAEFVARSHDGYVQSFGLFHERQLSCRRRQRRDGSRQVPTRRQRPIRNSGRDFTSPCGSISG